MKYEEKNTYEPLNWKIGDIVVCIDASGQNLTLTEGNQYKIEDINMLSFNKDGQYSIIVTLLIMNDRGYRDHFSANRFKTKEEIREEKFKELGILDESPI